MVVQSKSVYEPATDSDGVRVLVTNYWPRGITRGHAGRYMRILSPDRAALRAFKANELDWPSFAAMYVEAMNGDEQANAIQELTDIARDETLTVMCACRDTNECHRFLLKALIETRMNAE